MSESRRRLWQTHSAAAFIHPFTLLPVHFMHSFTEDDSMTYPFPMWEIPTVPIAGSNDRFPVRHIYCVGRNYAEHAKEMGGDASKDPPFFFTKAADSIVPVVPPAVGSIA